MTAQRSDEKGLHPCVGCGVELDADDPNDRCDECPIPPERGDPGALCPPDEHTPITTTRGTVLCEDCGWVEREADGTPRSNERCGERHPFQAWTCALFKGHAEPYHSQSQGKRWRVLSPGNTAHEHA